MTAIPFSNPRGTRWLVALLWAVIAVVAGTHQWAELYGTGKHLSWWQAFAWQGVSWMLMVPATLVLLGVLARWPLEAGRRRRWLWHGGASFTFGGIFLLVGMPVRHAFHPSPVRWSFFGEAFYKSVPQYVLLGTGLYWVVVAIGSLIETRHRLRAALRIEPGPQEEGESPGGLPANGDVAVSGPPQAHVLLDSASGTVRLKPGEIVRIESSSAGSRLETVDRSYALRHTLGQLENDLEPFGIVRIHRSHLVNAMFIREVTGAPSRDGFVCLVSGERLPVSRRRRPILVAALGRVGTSD